MDALQNQNNHELIYCRYGNSNNNRLTDYVNLDNRTDDPLSQQEVTMSLNDSSAQLPLHPLEELEEDMFDYEADALIQDLSTESEEQVVPSSQSSNNIYKYPEVLITSDDEIDEGIFEDEPVSDLVLPDDNIRYDSQPP